MGNAGTVASAKFLFVLAAVSSAAVEVADGMEGQAFGYNTDGLPFPGFQRTVLVSPASSKVSTFTNCFWFKNLYDRETMAYATNCKETDVAEKIACFDILHEDKRILVKYFGKEFTTPEDVAIEQRTWHHLCVAVAEVNSTATSLALFFNGEAVVRETFKTKSKFGLFEPGKAFALVLGQEQDAIGGKFETRQSFYGHLYDYRLWTVEMDEETIKNASKCLNVIDAYEDSEIVLNIDDAKSNHEVSHVSMEDVCGDRGRKNFYAVVPLNLPFNLALAKCGTLSSEGMAVPTTDDENRRMTELAAAYPSHCDLGKKTFWLGVNSDDGVGWRLASNGSDVVFADWRDGEPDEGDDCAAMGTLGIYRGKWDSVHCGTSRTYCSMCQVSRRDLGLTLHGLCDKTNYDARYYLDNVDDSMPAFRGASRGNIIWNGNTSWTMTSTDDKLVRVEATLEHAVLPIGRNRWKVVDPACGWRVPTEVVLSFSSCDSDGQFSCSDGTCISLGKRCNLVKDCADGSDEMDCRRVIFTDTYNKLLPPRTDSGSPLAIETSLEIELFNEISTLREELEVTFNLEMSWRDTQVSFFNLRENMFMNMVPTEDLERLWLPEIKLSNAKIGSRTLSSPNKFVACKRNTVGAPTGLEYHEESSVFAGSENDLVYKQHVKATFPCPFELSVFPFDVQRCCVGLKVTSAPMQLAFLNAVNFVYSGPERLKEFDILKRQLDVSNVTTHYDGEEEYGRSEISACFDLSRISSYHLMTTFFQSLVLGCISYFTLYIKLEDLRVRFTGALTALLVLVSLLNAANDSLPRSANIKFIDVWFIALILTSSIVVLLHIVVDKLLSGGTSLVRPVGPLMAAAADEKQEAKLSPTKAYSLNRGAQITVPIFFATFNAVGIMFVK